MLEAPVQEGEVLAGKYRVERILGVGGMGVVVAARHLQLDENVALKFLLPGGALSGEVVARFAREARAAAKIKSEHVARVTDVGVLDNGAPYMVMEYLSGVDLAGVIKQRGALPVEDAAEYLLQACEALGEAHSLGIVHRDLKPGNLFLARRHDGSPCVKVLDFGISKVTAALGGDLEMTATKAFLGSPLYMSPEQLMSPKTVDHRADVWALGVILYELLTATVPFNGDSVAHLAIQITHEPPRPMRDARPDIDAELEAIVLHCLEKDPSKRYQNVGEFAVALAEFGPKRARVSAERVSRMMRDAGLAGSALVLPPSSDAAPVVAAPPGGATAAAWGETRSVPARRSGAPLVIGAVAIAGLGSVAWFLTRTTAQGAHPVDSVVAVVAAPISSAVAAAPPASAAVTLAASSAMPSVSAPAVPVADAHAAEPQLTSANTKPAPVPAARASSAPRRLAASPATVAKPPAPASPPPPAVGRGFDFGGRD